MIPFKKVIVIKPGPHEDREEGTSASSTVVLIKGNKNIIVDAGAFAEDDKEIIKSLKKEDLAPEQIDIVIITHYHWDHVANINLFRNAMLYKCYTATSRVDMKNNASEFIEMKDGYKITDDVQIILTPGHVEHHLSIVVNTDKGKIVITGDAISEEEFKIISNRPKFVWSIEEYNKSREKILEIADYIVPGHGNMFEVRK